MQDTKELYKLTNPQKNIWNLEQFYKGTAINNICGSVLIKSETNLELLAKSINKFIENNDSFRTRIKIINGEPHQYFIENKTYKFETIYFKNIDEFQNYAKKEATIPFKIIESQLFKLKLFKLPNGFGGFIINAHHIISDAATFSMIATEITSNYITLTNHEEIPTKEYSYKNYIQAEHKYLTSPKFEKDKTYWKELYEKIPEVATIMPTKPIETPSISANRLECKFDKKLISKINKFCSENKLSLYNFLMAIYSIYLGKINNTKTLSIGTPILNRTNYAEKHTSGMFISTSLLKIDMQDNPQIVELIHTIAQTTIAMLKHQKYDYQYILNDVRQANTSVQKLYDVLLSYQITKATDTSLEIPYESTWYETPFISNSLEIHFHDNNDEGELTINYDYQTCKYEIADIQKIHSRILWIIFQILEKPYTHLNDIEIITPNEKKQILYNFNNTAYDYPKDKTIATLFEEQAQKTPNNTAIIFENQKMTYKELNEKANSLAYYLRNTYNIKANDLVGIMVNRSFEMLISILAILKAGGAYIPIDPAYPQARINHMLQNGNAQLLLTSKKLTDKINYKNTILVDLQNNPIYNTNTQNLAKINTSEDLAYVIFTSGSTGTPKGVMLKQRNIINFITGMMKEFKFNSNSVIASITTISFDIFVLESLMPLLNGLTIVIANENEQTNAQLFNKLCIKNNVEIIQTTPSRMQLFMQKSSNHDFIKKATHLLIGGEPFPHSLLTALKQITKAQIFNMYGPTETAVWSTLKNVSDTNKITIGTPIINTQIYILGKNLKPLPIDTPGEIYISGDGVSKGYLNNQELTKASFIDNPFIPNTLMYKTGDIGMYTDKGEIICLGRNDNQVKIRGLRIELEEIENKIQNYNNINTCIVTKKESKNHHEFLCAYFTSSSTIDTSKLRSYLEQNLPRYMIPSHFMQLSEMPYTPNGKIDRKKLPEPKIEPKLSHKIPPRNKIDTTLLTIIKNLLNIENIGINDNIIDLGADSLTAIKLSVQIQDDLGVQLFVQDIMEYPTIQDLSDLVSTKANTEKQIITPISKADFYETSAAQKRIFFASQLDEKNSILYNTPGGVILDKALNLSTIEKCIQTLIDRHEAFRTYFELQNEILVQKILDKIDFKLDILQNAKFKDIEKIYHNFVQPFDLKKAPLFRAKYITFTNGKSALFIDMHHIIADGTSISIFVDELCTLYNGQSLPQLHLTYKDYTNFENKQLASGKLKEAEDFWINQFNAELPTLEMPTNYPRPSTPSYKGHKVHTIIDEQTTKQLENFCKQLNITPYMLLLSIYYILLEKYTSQEDIIIGSPIANRTLPHTHNIIGMFVNTLPLRYKINDNIDFEHFVTQLKEYILNAYKYQAYPYNELVNALKLKTDNSRNPLFDTIFTYQNNGFKNISFKNVKAKYYIPDSAISKFDLSVEAIPNKNQINLSFEYSSALFNNDFIKNFAMHYLHILNIVLNDKTIKISDINILSPKEKTKILYKFNNKTIYYNKKSSIVNLFENQVNQTPNNIAVAFNNEQLTYKQLNQKANCFANFLLEQGVKKGSIVPVIMNRSTDLIISILSIIKLGATYLPISPDTPQGRIDYIIENCKAQFAITKTEVKLQSNVNLINIDKADYTSYNKQNLNINILPSDILYIIYTSGSTGAPKGVQVCHNNLINFVHSFTKLYGKISNKDRLLASTNISFDVSMFEIFITILNGATLYLYEEPYIQDIYKYCKSITENKITFAYIPPNILELVYNILEKSNTVYLDKLLLGVEPIKTETIKKYYTLNPNLKIINAYGPTETTICATAVLIDKHILSTNTTLPIGYPLHNLQIYILDSNLNPVPIGVPGEIYIAGENVSKGYLNNEELTQKAFIPLPTLNCKLAYKTGDLGKWDENGLIHFIGREDNQIKINGHRIELGEIEQSILSHPNTTKAVVLVNNQKKIVCYYTSSPKLEIDELKKFLKNKLPSYSIPNFFVPLESFALTPNGKIDKTKLINILPSQETKQITKPRNQTDLKLIKICKKLLNAEVVNIETNLFELGGDSLFTINLSVQIKDNFNIQLYIKDIFEHPTIKELSDILEQKKQTENLPIIPHVKTANYYEVSSAQKRIYFATKLDGNNSILYNIAGGIILDNYINTSKLETSIQTLLNRHEAFKTYFTIENATVVQKIKEHFQFTIDVIEDANFENIDSLFKEFVQPFDLEIAPLFRTKYIKFTNGQSAIFIDMHHIISDGTSMNIIIDELCNLYNGNPLPNLEITYKDFSAFENKEISLGKYEESKNYWINQFKGEIPVLNMPTKHQRPAVQSFEGNILHSSIDEKTTQKIEKLAELLGVTPYIILLSCYYILLSKYTSQKDIVVGSPIANRTLPQTASLIGMFVNTLALRNTIDNNLTFKEFVLNIKNNLLEAYKYQDYPYDELVDNLKIKRDTSRNPLFDTMFIYQSNGLKNIKFKDTNAQYYIPDLQTSKFDLSLEIMPYNNKMKLSMEYATKLFDELFIKTMCNNYLNIVHNVLQNNDVQLSKINMLSKEETEKIIYNFNATSKPYNEEKTIIDLFEEQVKKTPNIIAIAFEDTELTYKELNEKANSLAYFLRNTNNISNNTPVGIMVNRSIEMIVAILAVLKAGGAYIPIDPSFPKERIDYMLKNSNSKILLTQKKLQNKVDYKNTVLIDLDETQIYNTHKENLNHINKKEDLAYIIFTSGSTGNPKGVMITHKVLSNFTNYCNDKVKYLKDNTYQAIVSITTISFDIFFYETIISLQRGLKVVIANETQQNNPHLLNELLNKHDVKILQATPSRLQIFINNKNSMPQLASLKYIILAGEQLPLNLVHNIHSLSDITIYNGYGPSETYYSTLVEVHDDLVTIGTPIYNTQMYILDEYLNPVPIGVPGEIYIGGYAVGKGYLNNKELTSKSFIDDPFIPNNTMYKTGDLGMYLEDGNIICLGRVDHQIKIRGLRIELEEIEAIIKEYPNIKKVVVIKQVVNTREFISAYYVSSKVINKPALRKHLSKKLPKYMVPSYFVALDDLPYTPNGKIDRKQLPLPTEILNINTDNYVAPKTSLQKQIINIFEKVLGTGPIGINDNFFELGGDSLLAMTLTLELLKISDKIIYQDIFRYPTVSELEEKISSDENAFIFSKIENLSDDIVNVLNTCTKKAVVKNNHPKGILLTGGTGYLGIHIIEEFIKKERGNIYCIIRNAPGITARTRLHQKLNFYFGNKYDDLIDKRIFAIDGDILKPAFGLNQDKLLQLVNSVDTVIHSAAIVSHYGNHNVFYNTNVKSVKYIIDFCKSFDKRLYHISTIGVAGTDLDLSYVSSKRKNKTIIFDESSFYIGQVLDNYYSRTKFEAESCILNSICDGLDAYILRIGHLTPRYRDGVFQENILDNDLVVKTISFIKIGAVPDYLLDLPLEYTPVDSAAKSIIKLVTHSSDKNRIFHLYNHKVITVTKLIKAVQKQGFNVKIIKEREFKEKLKAILQDENSQNILNNLINDLNKDLHLNYKTDIVIKSDFTIKYLKNIFFRWPKISNKYLKRFIDLLRSVM